MPWQSNSGELLGTPPGLPHNRLEDLTPDLDVGEYSEYGRGRPALSSDAQPAAKWAVRQLQREMPRVEQFRSEARKAYAFFAGDAVDEVDRNLMEADNRPIINLNHVQRLIKVVTGIERRVPLAIFYVPRNPMDQRAAAKAQMATQAKEWAYDRAEADFEIARSKHDRNICGMGFLDSYLSRAEDPAGIIQIQRFSPMEAIWPQTSRECLKGTRWRARERSMPVEVAIQKWPFVREILSAASGDMMTKDYPIKADLVKYRVPWVMTEPTNKGGDIPPSPEDVRITDFQYTRPTEGYYFKDPILDTFRWMETKEYSEYARLIREQAHALPANVEKVFKDTFWRMFLLNRSLLLSGPEKMPIDGFSLNCITGDWDEKRKLWYGLVRLYQSPQLLIDKSASSAIEILSAQTKSGLDVEVGAMSEPQAAEYRKTATLPGAIHWFKRNALSENRVKPKTPPTVPTGQVTLLEFASKEIEALGGYTQSLINPGDSTGVGLRKRLSLGLLLLANYFDSSARFERQQGTITLQYMKLIADDRWVRIGGPMASQAVQLVKEDFEDEYDTTVDDCEQDPTIRAQYQDNVLALAATLIKQNKFFPEFLDWFLIPGELRMALKQRIQQSSQQEMQMRMKGINPTGRGKQRTQEEIMADVRYRTAQATLAEAKAKKLGADMTTNDLKLVLQSLVESTRASNEQRKMQHEHGMDLRRHRLDILNALKPENTAA
jgi:hypothetical protein